MDRPVDIAAEAAAQFQHARNKILAAMPEEAAFLDKYRAVFVAKFQKKIAAGGWVPKPGWLTAVRPVTPTAPARPTTPPAEPELTLREARRIMAYAYQQFRASRRA